MENHAVLWNGYNRLKEGVDLLVEVSKDHVCDKTTKKANILLKKLAVVIA